MRSDYPETAAQENFLCLLCFDEQSALIIRGYVDVELFESNVYREIASQAVGFLDSYKKPIGQHLPDMFEHILQGEDKRKAGLYSDTIMFLKGMHDEGINTDFVLSQLHRFVQKQSLKKAVMVAAESIQSDNIEEAEQAIDKYWRQETSIFDAGQFLNVGNATSFLDVQADVLPTGIPFFNTISFGLEPKTTMMIIAASGRGKTWGLIHFGKMAAINRQKVLHVTLEMSEEKIKARYMQSFLSLSRRDAEHEITRFETEHGSMSRLVRTTITRPTLSDPGIRKYVQDRVNKVARRMAVVVKGFPTNTLTIRGLEAYLDSLDRQHHFQPDVIILDYLDLMQVSAESLRLDLGVIGKDFRRVCVERSMCGATASQTNRSGEDVKIITSKHLAEDYSKAQTSDRVMTYNQTRQEKALGLARLFVAKNRDEEDNGLVIVSQRYHIGQFCLDSALLSQFYDDAVLELAGDQ